MHGVEPFLQSGAKGTECIDMVTVPWREGSECWVCNDVMISYVEIRLRCNGSVSKNEYT